MNKAEGGGMMKGWVVHRYSAFIIDVWRAGGVRGKGCTRVLEEDRI